MYTQTRKVMHFYHFEFLVWMFFLQLSCQLHVIFAHFLDSARKFIFRRFITRCHLFQVCLDTIELILCFCWDPVNGLRKWGHMLPGILGCSVVHTLRLEKGFGEPAFRPHSFRDRRDLNCPWNGTQASMLLMAADS